MLSVLVFLNYFLWRDLFNNFIVRWIFLGFELFGLLGSEFFNERVVVFCSKILLFLLLNVFFRISCDLFEFDLIFWFELIDGSGLYFENDDCDFSGVGKDVCFLIIWKFFFEVIFFFLSLDLGRNRFLVDLGRYFNFFEEVFEGGRGINDVWFNENLCLCEMFFEVWWCNKLFLIWGWFCIILVLCWVVCVLLFVYIGKGLFIDLLLGGLLLVCDWGWFLYFFKKKK